MAVFASAEVRRRTLGTWDPGVLVVPDLVLFVGASAGAAITADRRLAAVAATWTAAVAVALGAYGLLERAAGWGVVLMAAATVGTVAAAATLWSGAVPMRWFFIGPFTFRPAAARSRAQHLRRSLVQLVVFWSLFFLVVPFVVSAAEQRLRVTWPALEQPWLVVLGATTFVLASGLGLWSCCTMALRGEGTPLPAETARRLVVAGPYRSVRNPMAVAGALQTAGVGLWLGSWIVVALAGAGAVTWNQLIRPHEEADLHRRFGTDYEAYRARVRCWIPTLPSGVGPAA